MAVRSRDERSGSAALPSFLLGAASAVVGLLPWLRTGARLPLQNLWSVSVPPEQMPRALLPFSQYELTTLVGLLVTGAVVGGVVARAGQTRGRRVSVAALFVGLLAVQLLALAQTTWVTHAGLSGVRVAQVYLAALVGGSAATVAVGVVVYWLVARAPRGGALLGLGTAVVPFASWASPLLVPDPAAAGTGALMVLEAVRWVPAVLLGAAAAWAGLATVGRVVAFLVGLLLLWLGPAAVTAVVNAAGSRALAREPVELGRYASEVFVAAATTPSLVLPPLVVAVVVALLGLAGRRLLRPRAGT